LYAGVEDAQLVQLRLPEARKYNYQLQTTFENCKLIPKADADNILKSLNDLYDSLSKNIKNLED
jgi:predicted RecB family nuclease